MVRISLLILALAAPVRAQSWSALLEAVPGKIKIPDLPAIPALPADGPVIISSQGAAAAGTAELFEALASAEFVYVGERHDQASHHLTQLEVLKGVRARRPGVCLGLEMLDFTQQATLDQYLSGAMSEADFKAFWQKAWGYSFDIYRPLLDYARREGIAVRALNAPISVVRQVAKGGLSSLSAQQRALIPAVINPIRDPRYLAYVRKSLSEHGPMDPVREARMLEAMAVWNETMADSLLKAAASGPVVTAVGMGHVLYDAGILESLRGRSSLPQAAVLPYPLDGEELPLAELLRRLREPGSPDLELAGWFWLLPAP